MPHHLKIGFDYFLQTHHPQKNIPKEQQFTILGEIRIQLLERNSLATSMLNKNYKRILII